MDGLSVKRTFVVSSEPVQLLSLWNTEHDLLPCDNENRCVHRLVCIPCLPIVQFAAFLRCSHLLESSSLCSVNFELTGPVRFTLALLFIEIVHRRLIPPCRVSACLCAFVWVVRLCTFPPARKTSFILTYTSHRPVLNTDLRRLFLCVQIDSLPVQ